MESAMKDDFSSCYIGKPPEQPKCYGRHPHSKSMNCNCLWFSECKREVKMVELEVKREMLRTAPVIISKFKPFNFNLFGGHGAQPTHP